MKNIINVPARNIAVFDAGIGSFDVVQRIRARSYAQNIVYLADRASFPYGNKSRHEMLITMRSTVDFLSRYHADAIVLASNAPSIMVLDELRKHTDIPIHGIKPPILSAIECSETKHIAILGVKSLVESVELKRFICRYSEGAQSVLAVNASSLVDLVENGNFLFNPEDTQQRVNKFIYELLAENPLIDTLTLSPVPTCLG